MFNPKIGLLFSIAFLSAFALKAEPIKIIMENGASPWSKDDGTGYANEIVKAALNAVHVETQYSVQPYSRCKANVISGEAAACLSMSFSEDTKSSVVFSQKPLFICNSDVYTQKGGNLIVKSPIDIPKGTVVGVVAGYEYPPSVQKLKERGIDFIEYPSEKSLLKKLASGKVNFVIINNNDLKPVSSLIAEVGADKKVAFAFTAGTLESYIGFSKKHERGDWLKAKFDEGYELISKDGSLDKIQKKWQQPAK